MTKPLTTTTIDLDRLLGVQTDKTIDFVRRTTKPIEDRLAVLERRLGDLELRPPALAYRGVWKAGGTYRPGDCVTLSGGLWVCGADPAGARPGSTPCWQLAVKKGAVAE